LEIAVDILEVAKSGSHKTRIMYQANLSFELLRKYLDYLTRAGLLRAGEREARVFVTTAKGHRFLEEFYELRRYSEIVESKRLSLERDLAGLHN
jgi:predicted transcriptional regulator